jgi:Na+/phosphate symporter
VIIYLSLLVAVIGALMYGLSKNPKLVEIGRIMLAAGLLTFLLRVAEGSLKVFLP